jgi:probable HAF family extracellular repeat protein
VRIVSEGRGKMFRLAARTLAMVAALAPFGVSATPVFTGLGALQGGGFTSVHDVSADGRVIVGAGYPHGSLEAVRWEWGGHVHGLGDFVGGRQQSLAKGVSGDGGVVVGYGSGPDGVEAFRWTAQSGMQGLGDLPGGTFYSNASGVSDDGSVVVGTSIGPSGQLEAFRWTDVDGLRGLGTLPGGSLPSEARGVSGDGQVVFGYAKQTSSPAVGSAFRWTAQSGMSSLGALPSGSFTDQAVGSNRDGTVIVGAARDDIGLYGENAFRWTDTTGMRSLGAPYAAAHDVTDNGSLVVGTMDGDAYIWDGTRKGQRLQDLLERDYGLEDALEGWLLVGALAVSSDGLTIIGTGTNPNGITEPWAVRLAAFRDPAPQVPLPPVWTLLAVGLATMVLQMRCQVELAHVRQSPRLRGGGYGLGGNRATLFLSRLWLYKRRRSPPEPPARA